MRDDDRIKNAVLEAKAAQIIGSLLREQFLAELNLFRAISPTLSFYKKEELERRLVSKVHQAIR